MLSLQQQKLIRSLQINGNYSSESDVLDDALELLRQRNELRSLLKQAEDQISKGDKLPAGEATEMLKNELDQHS